MQPSRPLFPFFRSVLSVVLPVAAAAAAGWAWQASRVRADAALERELAVARELADGESVVEITRRLAAADPRPARRLALAEALLDVRRFAELERELTALRPRAPELLAEVLALQARAAEAQDQDELALARWNERLGLAGLAAPARAATLDHVVELLEKLGRLEGALARAGERLALETTPAARLQHGRLAVRLRRWKLARADFDRLRAEFADDAEVKTRVPAWERVERALPAVPELGAPAFVETMSPAAQLARRALAQARLGLWQNAADDVRALQRQGSTPRFAAVLAGWITGRGDGANERIDDPTFARLPWLAGSAELGNFAERSAARGPQLEALLALDEGFSVPGNAPPADAALAARRATLLLELGAPALAWRDAEPLINQRPELLAGWLMATRAQLALGEPVRAHALLERARAQREKFADDAPALAEFDALAGRVAQVRGAHPEADAAYTAALDGGPPDDPRRAEWLRARAASRRFLQRFAEAAADLAAAEKLEAIAEAAAARGEVVP